MVEVLVEIQASAGVVLRGSTTGVVLSDGRSFADFDVLDFSAERRLGRFPSVDEPAGVFLDAPFERIRSFDDTYGLAGKAVVVRVGQGRQAADYDKPSSGTARGLVWTFYGFIPVNWTIQQDTARGTCRIFLKDALGYRSNPVLTDHVDRSQFPRAFSPGALFPILFGGEDAPVPGSVLFPMQRIDRQVSPPNRGTWSLGNLPLATGRRSHVVGVPDPLTDVLASPYDTGGLDGDKDEARARFSNVTQEGRSYNVNRVIWYIGTGIGTTRERPLPGVATGALVESLGDVLYWLLRYKGGIAASALDHEGLYGTRAPTQITEGACYYFVDRPLETATAAEQIGREAMAPLVQVDGFRQGAGAQPRWTLADVYINAALRWSQIAPVDPGWLFKDVEGRPLITPVAAHRLYANSVDIRFGDWPAVSNLPSQSYYLERSAENLADRAARGVKHLELAFSWNNSPGLLLGGPAGLASDRWGSWTAEVPPLTYSWAFRLPFGDVLPGDLLHFGPFADVPNRSGSRLVYVVESTRLNIRAGLLECRGPALLLPRS